ncbi:MAG: tetratricopeptide repeat-containing sensor histidine kinase [bacterium]
MTSKTVPLLICFLFFLTILQVPATPLPETKTESNTPDTAGIIPGFILILESGQRTPEDRQKMDSLIMVSRNLAYIPGVGRGLMMIGVYYWSNPDSSLRYLHLARKYCHENQYYLGYFLSVHNLGTLYLNYGIQDSAFFYLMKAMSLWKPEIGMQRHARLQLDLGTYYSSKDDYQRSLGLFLSAMKTMKGTGDTVKLRSVYNNLGVLYTNLFNFQKAKYYYEQVFPITPEAFMNGRIWADAYNNLGAVYMDVKKDNDSALIFFRRSVSLSRKYNQMDRVPNSFMNMGNAFLATGRIDSALHYYRLAKGMINKFTRRNHQAGIFINYAVALKWLGQLDSAEYYGQKGIMLLPPEGTGNLKITGYELLFSVDSARGKYASAISYLQQSYRLSKKMHSEEILKKINEKEFEYQLDQKEEENRDLINENRFKEKIIVWQTVILIAGILFLLMLVGILFVISRSRKKLKRINQELQFKNEEIRMHEEEIAKQNKALLDLNNTRNRFFSIISHDLRSPFNSLLGFLQELIEGYDTYSDDERKRILSSLSTSSQNTYHLLENLLEWALSQQGQIIATIRTVRVREVAVNILGLLQSRADKKGVALEMAVDEEMYALADPVLLANTLLNITNNAIKFTGKGGRIILSSIRKDDKIEISCKDTGIGIPAEFIDQLFRVDGNVKRLGTDREPGTGLGLILCQEFVGLMNGSLRVVSLENEGTEIIIMLPTATNQNQTDK